MDARKSALRLLSMKNYHGAVLKRKLLEKGFSEEIVDQVIADCKRMGFCNDKEAILSELRRGWGPRAIEYKLRLTQEEVRTTISRAMQKKRIVELKAKGKTFRALQSKGFDIELLIEIFSCREVD